MHSLPQISDGNTNLGFKYICVTRDTNSVTIYMYNNFMTTYVNTHVIVFDNFYLVNLK